MAKGLMVGGDVFFDSGFTSAGIISLRSACIGGSLYLRPAKSESGRATLDAGGARISGTLLWAPLEPFEGEVNLEGASAGWLEDYWPTTGEPGNGYWPGDGKLRLDGFTYGGFSGKNPATVMQRLEWIRSQYKGIAAYSSAIFATQPYEQLIAVYRQAGQDADACEVAIARRSDLRRFGKLNWYRKFGNWLLDATIKYGYQTWRAATGLIALYLIVIMLAILAQHMHVIVPVGNTAGIHPIPNADRCISDYPCFYPAGYAIDTVIPIINVHQADNWGLDGHAPWGWAWLAGTWIVTGFGWALATLLVAGYTGLARQQ